MIREKKDWLLNLACLGFLYVTLLINVYSADPLPLKSPEPLEKKQFLGLVLVFEQRQNKDNLGSGQLFMTRVGTEEKMVG